MILLDVVPLPLTSYHVFQNQISDIKVLKMTASYSQRGGVNIGHAYVFSMNGTWPFAHLSVTDTGITLQLFWKRYYFNKGDVSAIRQYNGFLPFSTGVQILHTMNDYPPFVVFWSFRRKKLLSELQRLGYSIIL